MKKDNKIIVIIISVIASAALLMILFFGTHYLFENPTGIVFSPDMKTFTVVSGGDYTQGEIADYFRSMKKQEFSYMKITDKIYCAEGDNTYALLVEMMSEKGYEYIGSDEISVNIRYFYKDGKMISVRVEHDINAKWCLWNLGNAQKYDLDKEGYKKMD